MTGAACDCPVHDGVVHHFLGCPMHDPQTCANPVCRMRSAWEDRRTEWPP